MESLGVFVGCNLRVEKAWVSNSISDHFWCNLMRFLHGKILRVNALTFYCFLTNTTQDFQSWNNCSCTVHEPLYTIYGIECTLNSSSCCYFASAIQVLVILVLRLLKGHRPFAANGDYRGKKNKVMPSYTIFNVLLGSGSGVIGHFLTLGKCYVFRYVPGFGAPGFQLASLRVMFVKRIVIFGVRLHNH